MPRNSLKLWLFCSPQGPVLHYFNPPIHLCTWQAEDAACILVWRSRGSIPFLITSSHVCVLIVFCILVLQGENDLALRKKAQKKQQPKLKNVDKLNIDFCSACYWGGGILQMQTKRQPWFLCLHAGGNAWNINGINCFTGQFWVLLGRKCMKVHGRKWGTWLVKLKLQPLELNSRVRNRWWGKGLRQITCVQYGFCPEQEHHQIILVMECIQ